MNDEKKPILINIPANIKEELKSVCKEKGVTITSFINSLIKKALHPLDSGLEEINLSELNKSRLIKKTHGAIDAVSDLQKEIIKLSYELKIHPQTEGDPAPNEK